jgi:RNA polymerase sigma-70 factor, ECF subfamily
MSTEDKFVITDQELVERVLYGDSQAYGIIYDRYIAAVYRYVFFLVNEHCTAEDLTENVFVKTLEYLRKNKTKILEIKPWLFKTAKNLVIDYYRVRKTESSLDEISSLKDTELQPEQSLLLGERSRRLRQAIQKLEPIQQEVLEYRFINGLSYEETASITGLSVSHLRVVQFRSLKRLSGLLEEDRIDG